MSKKNRFSQPGGQLGKPSPVRAPSAPSLVGSTVGPPNSATLRPAKNDGFKPESLTSKGISSSGIRFGAPSQRTTSTSSTTSPWTHLLTNTLSGGLSNALGGGGGSLLSIVGGFGGLISGIAGLFGGGKKTPPPLQLFSLPSARNEDISISPQSISGPVYGTSPHPQSAAPANTPAVHGQSSSTQSAEVANAVKLALLNSSSLSDVISEL